MILAIDDVKECGWADIVARNAFAGEDVLTYLKGIITELYIDFDLGPNSESGLDVIKFGLNHNCLPNIIIIVSWNPAGRGMIKDILLENGFKFINGSRYERK